MKMSSEVNEMEELGPSELGTKEYWDKTYCEEMRNFQDHGDIGEVWFGEDSALRIVKWLCSSTEVKSEDKIIDLGCGNGMLLVELFREGFTRLTGIDYSESAIALAREVTNGQDMELQLEVANILAEQQNWLPIPGVFGVALDKGTYDAISLSPDNARAQRCQYLASVSRLLRPAGLLIITSCNWTQDELLSHFDKEFKLLDVIPTPTFQFGGKTGNLITSLVLQKRL